MKGLSFFATPSYASPTTPPYLKRGSSSIRGEQMAAFLGAKFNPQEGYEDDVRVYIKPAIEGAQGIVGIKEESYVDVIEDIHLIDRLIDYPKLKIIVLSNSGRDFLKKAGYKNDVIVIPQHHCNFERHRNEEREAATVGIIGSRDSFDYPTDEFRRRMEEIGLRFVTNHSFLNRREVVDFYKQLDIQVSWNTDPRRKFNRQKLFRDSLRIKNAASFGIPTVAFPEVNYKEFEGNYIPVRTIDEMVVEIKKLKDERYYREWSDTIVNESEKYHIGVIAKMYEKLRA